MYSEPLKLRSSTKNVLSQNLKESEQYRKHAAAIQRELRAVAVTLGAKRQQFLRDKSKLLHDLDLYVEDEELSVAEGDRRCKSSFASIDPNAWDGLYAKESEVPEGHRRAKSCPQPNGSTLADTLKYVPGETTSPYDDMDISGAAELKGKSRARAGKQSQPRNSCVKSSKPVVIPGRSEKCERRTTISEPETLKGGRLGIESNNKNRSIRHCRDPTFLTKPRAFSLTLEQEKTHRKVQDFLDKTSANRVERIASDLQPTSDHSDFSTNPNTWMDAAAERKRRVSHAYPAETFNHHDRPQADSTIPSHHREDQKPLRLPPLMLPPIHRGVRKQLQRRSWTPEIRNSDSEEELEELAGPVTDKEWEDLKMCRYLRISDTSHGSAHGRLSMPPNYHYK